MAAIREIAGAGGAPLTLIVETGVPARVVNSDAPPIIDIEANGAEMLPAPVPADINGLDDD